MLAGGNRTYTWDVDNRPDTMPLALAKNGQKAYRTMQRVADVKFAKPYNDLRELIAALEESGKLIRISREINKDTELHPLVRWQFRGLKEEERKAFLFENVTDSKKRKYHGSVLVGGLAGSAAIYCLGLKCQPEEVADRWLYAMDHTVEPEIVNHGPVLEEIHKGQELFSHGGFSEFPVPISTPGFDNGPYITAGHWITKDPETGKRNVGNYRGLIKGPGLSGIMSGTPQDLSRHWEKCRKRGIPLEVAVAVGTVPAVSYAATQKVPPTMDELALAGGLVGEPIKLVKCQTVDLEVPATAEVVLEGIIPTSYLEEEGPFGESMGYVDPRTLSGVFELTCITHRKNPIWVSIISQVTPSESSKIKAMGMATLILRYLKQKGFSSVLEVSLMEPLVNLRPYVVLRMKKRDDQDPWGAMNALLDYGDRVGKLVVAVDEDINPHDPVAVTWAITHRSQPHKDVKVVGNRPFGATPIGMVATHPSSRYDNSESSLLIDATRKADFPPLSLPKKEYMERAREIWEELGLPKLEPQEPWHGYSLGLWPEELDEEARLAAQGDYDKVGKKLRDTRVQVGEGETLGSMRTKWGRSHSGRAE
ncbi:MAG: UbiD family decarboxylase [Deltaproteobacteria bacterium]|nr:UbiD family decarboxylase [Deltaproteobacteria bacterium]